MFFILPLNSSIFHWHQLVFLGYNGTRFMMKLLQKYLVCFVLFFVVLASTWALFSQDFFRFHDFTQGARIVEMINALRDGHFPVIWSSNLGYGYGMPLFEFYAPLPYYFGSLFFMGGFSLIGSIKMLLFISSLVTAIGGYLIGKKLFGTLSGLLTSAAITLAPYRAVNLYVRGALSEAWGIMALPFILLGVIKTIKNERYGWVLLTSSILILLLSHNLTALIFLPFSVLFGAGYLLFEVRENKRKLKKIWQTLSTLVGSYVLAFVLSAFYTVPALLEKNFTRLESTILADYFDYNLHFVYIRQFFTENWGYGGSTYGPLDGISFYLGFGQLIGLFLSGFILFKVIKSTIAKKGKLVIDSNMFHYFIVVVLCLVALLLTTQKTQFIWDAVPALSFLQFPWRYLSAGIVFLGISVGALVKFLPNIFSKVFYTVVLLFVLVLLNYKYFQPQEFTSDLGEYYYADANKLRQQMSTTLPDYIPIQIKQNQISPVALEGQVLYCQVLNNCTEDFEITTNKVHKKIVTTNFKTEQKVVFTVADFPGWTAVIDGVAVSKEQSQEGYLQVAVPAGKHVVLLELKNTFVRNTSNLVSSLGLVIFLGLFFWYYNNNDRKLTSRN